MIDISVATQVTLEELQEQERRQRKAGNDTAVTFITHTLWDEWVCIHYAKPSDTDTITCLSIRERI